MKSLFAPSVWLIASAMLCLSFSGKEPAVKPEPTTDCRSLLTEILAEYNEQVDDATNVYMVLEQESYAAAGQHTTRTEIAKAGERVRIENDLYTLFRDETTTVLVSKTANTIILRPTEPGSDAVAPSGGEVIDSLLARTSRVDCSAANMLTFYIEDAMVPHMGGIRKVDLEYDPASHMVTKGIYHFVATQSGITQQTITYGTPQAKSKGKAFKGAAMAQVMDSRGALLDAYRSYQVKDLRTISTQK